MNESNDCTTESITINDGNKYHIIIMPEYSLNDRGQQHIDNLDYFQPQKSDMMTTLDPAVNDTDVTGRDTTKRESLSQLPQQRLKSQRDNHVQTLYTNTFQENNNQIDG